MYSVCVCAGEVVVDELIAAFEEVAGRLWEKRQDARQKTDAVGKLSTMWVACSDPESALATCVDLVMSPSDGGCLLEKESRKEASDKRARLGASRPAVIDALRQKYGEDPGKWTCEDKTIFRKDVFADSHSARDITAFVDTVIKQCNDLYCNDASQYAPQEEDCVFTGFNGDVWVCYEASQRLAIKYLAEVKSTTRNVDRVKNNDGNSKYKHSLNTEFSQLWYPGVYGFTGELTLAKFLECLFVGRYVMTVFSRSVFAAHIGLQLKTKRIKDNAETSSAADDQGWLRRRLICILHGKTDVFQSDVRIAARIATTGYRLRGGVWADGTRRNNSHAILHGGHAVPWMRGTNLTSRSQQDCFACSNMSQATRVQLQVVSSSSVVEPCACISVEVLDSSIITSRT